MIVNNLFPSSCLTLERVPATKVHISNPPMVVPLSTKRLILLKM